MNDIKDKPNKPKCFASDKEVGCCLDKRDPLKENAMAVLAGFEIGSSLAMQLCAPYLNFNNFFI